MVAGSGQFLASLCSSLSRYVTDPGIMNIHSTDWQQDFIKPFDFVFYASEDGSVEVIRWLEDFCRRNGKWFLPGCCIGNLGMVGPLIDARGGIRWDSAWRTIPSPMVFGKEKPRLPDYAVYEILAHVMIAKWLRSISGTAVQDPAPSVYLLQLETLEGQWYPLQPHPLLDSCFHARWMDMDELQNENPKSRLRNDGHSTLFKRLSRPISNIIYHWGEADLPQLPLAQCRIQLKDPLSGGPALLMDAKVTAGFTHEEARREAGFAGIEQYSERMLPLFLQKLRVPGPDDFLQQNMIGVGAGSTHTEAICRGLTQCLERNLKQPADTRSGTKVKLSAVHDQRSLYFLRSLSFMRGEPIIAMADQFGFPVIAVGTEEGRWYQGVGLNPTFALRSALLQALQDIQNGDDGSLCNHPASFPLKEQPEFALTISAEPPYPRWRHLEKAKRKLQQNGKQLKVFEMTMDPLLPKNEAGIFGVILGEEDNMR